MGHDNEELQGVPKPGDLIAGKYLVDSILGVGGMGCVVAATHTGLEQRVAIKFLLAKIAKNPKNVQRFSREARAAARIKSDHVARVSDVATLEDGTPYMVMEHLDGQDLAERLKRGPLPVSEAVDYLLQACEALAEAHQAGIVHRDLKPANLFLSKLPNGSMRVKVLDFGISKIEAEPGRITDQLTQTSSLMGSPIYMSPEQMISAKEVDHRTDIWALGCIFFELLTGRPPFLGNTLPEICGSILAQPATKLSEALNLPPPELERAIDICLAKEPGERYQHLGQLALAIAHFGSPAAGPLCQAVLRLSPAIEPAAPQTPTSPQPMSPAAPTGTPAATAFAPAPAIHTPTVGNARPLGSPQAVAHPPAPNAALPTTGGHCGSANLAAVSAPGAAPLAPSSQLAAANVSPLAAGASTASPVAQTMSGTARPRWTWLAAIGAIALLLFLGLLVVKTRRAQRQAASSQAAASSSAASANDPEVPAATSSPEDAAPTGYGSEYPTNSAEPEPLPPASASATTSASTEANIKAVPTSTPRSRKRALRRMRRKLRTKPPRPSHRVKDGDDQFN